MVDKITFSVKVVKCLNMMTGDNSKKVDCLFGKLIPESQIEIKPVPGSFIDISSQNNEKNIFRPDFTIEDMGIGGLDD